MESEYALDVTGQMGKDETYLKAIKATRDAILALKPMQSTIYKPTSIRVGVFRIRDSIIATAAAWPLADTLTPSQRNQWRTYWGADAKAVIEALTENAFVKSGGVVYRVVWVPNISIPDRTPTK